jgi:hypothetical protein
MILEFPDKEWFDAVKAETNTNWKMAYSIIKEALETKYNMKNHRRANTLFALAWEHGHACGVYDIVGFYVEFATLLEDDSEKRDSYPHSK